MSATATGSATQLKLVIPGLLGTESGVMRTNTALRSSLPSLETVLARSDRLANARTDFEALAFELFNIKVDANRDLPIAAVTRVLDMGVVDNGWWLRADPVHLRPDHDRLLLADDAILQVTQAEADQLAAELIEAYANDGWILKAARPDRWYLKPPSIPEIRTAPLPAVVGRNVHDYLPQGEDGKAWCTILNEIQILLHTARINVDREQRGALPINSLWFWGGGKLPEPQRVGWSKVWTDEPVSLALARLSQTPTAPAPGSAEEWLSAAHGGEHLVVLAGMRPSAQYGDVDSWRELVQELEQQWMTPLLSALTQGAVQSITLYTEFASGFTITAKRSRRWWRRRRPLASYR
jgi:hypothetical protein